MKQERLSTCARHAALAGVVGGCSTCWGGSSRSDHGVNLAHILIIGINLGRRDSCMLDVDALVAERAVGFSTWEPGTDSSGAWVNVRRCSRR